MKYVVAVVVMSDCIVMVVWRWLRLMLALLGLQRGMRMTIVGEKLSWDQRFVRGLASWMVDHAPYVVFLIGILIIGLMAGVFGG